MAELDWSILRTNQPVDIAGNFARGYQLASTIVDKMHERNALAALANTPNDPSALATLYQVNPQLADHFQRRGEQLQATQRRAAIGAQYAGGDSQGARTAAVSSGDFDLAEQLGKLDEATQKRTVDFWEKAGPVAFKLKSITDPAQRQAFWQQAKPILQSEGVDTAALDKFDPTNDVQLDAAITTSQKIGDLISQGKIEWHQQGENPSFATNAMGVPIGSANPATVAVSGGAHPPQAAVEYLKAHPDLAAHFDEKYGPGASASILGGATGNPSHTFPVNNPGNLRVPGSTQFQRFSSPQEGIHAQVAQLGRYMNRGLRNVSSIVETYAPRISRGGDNTDEQVNNYIAYVSKRLGVNPADALSPALLPQLGQAMREFETGQRGQ